MTSTSPAQAGAPEGAVGSVFRSLRNSWAAAGKYADESGLAERIAPVVNQGKEAAASGLSRVNQVASAANDVVTNKETFEEQRRLNDLFVEVMSVQQGLIEELRARVAVLESNT